MILNDINTYLSKLNSKTTHKNPILDFRRFHDGGEAWPLKSTIPS